MRVLHLTPHPDLRNGISEYAGTFARAMRDAAGVTMDRVAFEEGTRSRAEIARALDAIDPATYDVVHGELGAGTNSVYYGVAHLSRVLPGRVVVTLHDPPHFLFSPTLDWYGYRVHGMLNKAARRLVTDPLYNTLQLPRVARRIGQYVVLNRGAVRRTRARVPDAIVHYVPLVADADARRGGAGAPTEVLFYGFIAHNKGIDVALAAVAKLRADGVRVRLHVVGGCLDPRYERHLRDEVVRLQIDGHVVWHGFVDAAALDAVLDACGVAVLPYRDVGVYGASAAIVRLMKHGRPVLVSDTERFTDEFTPGQDVLTFRAGDAADLATRLGALIADAGLRTRIAAGGHRRVTSAHAPAAVAAQFMAVYEAAAGRPADRTRGTAPRELEVA